MFVFVATAAAVDVLCLFDVFVCELCVFVKAFIWFGECVLVCICFV